MNPKPHKILIIDDDVDVLHSAELFLKQYFAEISKEPDPARINPLVSANQFDLVLLDMNFRRGEHDGREGLYWLERIRTITPQTAVILITAYGDIELAVEAMRRGAANFILKPWKNSKLLEVIETTLGQQQKSALSGNIASANSPEVVTMIGSSPAMQRIYQLIDKVADTEANVLILGENGTGKELVAQALHQKSSRRRAPFVRVDLGALTPTLFESEMFGHVKGAFTDAYQDKPGKFELAQGGTIFLDEIGNLSPTQQAKLLTVLQQRKVSRVGGNQEIKLDVRLVCATNRSLYEVAEDGAEGFRQDLLYRINTVEITVPPLRERADDIPLLTEFFLRIYGTKYHKPDLRLSETALQKLRTYSWPGNVRELQHALERSVILTEDAESPRNQRIGARSVPKAFGAGASSPKEIQPNRFVWNDTLAADVTTASGTLDENERNFIKKAMARNQGNITKTAQELGITRTALYRRLEKYGL